MLINLKLSIKTPPTRSNSSTRSTSEITEIKTAATGTTTEIETMKDTTLGKDTKKRMKPQMKQLIARTSTSVVSIQKYPKKNWRKKLGTRQVCKDSG
jgi:hypothetical protein